MVLLFGFLVVMLLLVTCGLFGCKLLVLGFVFRFCLVVWIRWLWLYMYISVCFVFGCVCLLFGWLVFCLCLGCCLDCLLASWVIVLLLLLI